MHKNNVIKILNLLFPQEIEFFENFLQEMLTFNWIKLALKSESKKALRVGSDDSQEKLD